jgi:hypothetical protein
LINLVVLVAISIQPNLHPNHTFAIADVLRYSAGDPLKLTRLSEAQVKQFFDPAGGVAINSRR